MRVRYIDGFWRTSLKPRGIVIEAAYMARDTVSLLEVPLVYLLIAPCLILAPFVRMWVLWRGNRAGLVVFGPEPPRSVAADLQYVPAPNPDVPYGKPYTRSTPE